MHKHSTVILLGILVVFLSAYILWDQRMDQKRLLQSSQGMQTTKSADTELKGMQKISGFLYQKITGPRKAELYLVDNTGQKKMIEVADGFQMLDSRQGEVLIRKSMHGDEWRTIDNPAGFHYVTQIIDGSGAARPVSDIDADDWAKFSPDGSKIVYVATGPKYPQSPYAGYIQDIYVLNSDGTNKQKVSSDITKGLTDGVQYSLIGWGSNDKIYFTRGTIVQEGQLESGLWALNLSTGTWEKADSSGEYFSNAAIISGGNSIAYVSSITKSSTSSENAIKKFDVRTGEKTMVLSDPSTVYEIWSVSPDGTKIIFTKQVNKANTFWTLNLSDGYPTSIGIDAYGAGWAGNDKLALDVKTENSLTTNADDLHELKAASLAGHNPIVVDTFTGPGSFQFFGAI